MSIPNVRIAATAYSIPPGVETVDTVMERERARIDAALAPLGAVSKRKALEGLGLCRVHVCGEKQPYDLILESSRAALEQAGVKPIDVNLIIDYSTFPGERSQYRSFAHVLSNDLGSEASLNLSFKAGGCAGLHLALKTAIAHMSIDDSIRTALLVTGDTPPADNRSLLPITVQGDAGCAVVLSRDGSEGPLVLGVEVMTLGHLHNAIALTTTDNRLEIRVDSAQIEGDVMPVYYLNLLSLIEKLLQKVGVKLDDIDHFIYSNISQRDRDGFRRMLALSPAKLPVTGMTEYGHTFASDLVINYTDLRTEGLVRPGQLALFASAGIGFTWGVTLVRA